MGPYFAVIYDSFYEAIKSRVLWILIVGWTIMLAALAPFGWVTGSHFDFVSESIVNRDRLARELLLAQAGGGDLKQQRVWDRIDQQTKKHLQEVAVDPSKGPVRMGILADGLNSALGDSSLYSEEAWPTAGKLNEIAAELSGGDTESLNPEDLAKVNRRLIELAFPASLRTSDGNSIWVGYAGLKIGDPLLVPRDQLTPFIEGAIMPGILQLSLGVIGILVAVVVTSNLIPDMFAPGSMSLLLSKPISRSGLLIAKFVGGVGFIAINVIYLLVGLYFLLGWRLQIWNFGVLWCIPIFVFVFMIFYSVSVLVGLIWKNAIVSIVFVALFWGVCFVMGITHEQMRTWAVDLPQLTSLEIVDQHVVGASRRGELLMWNEAEQKWNEIGKSDGRMRRVLGPCWVEERKTLVYGRPEWNPFVGIQTDRINLQSIDLHTEGEGADESISAVDPTLPLTSEKRIDLLAELPSRSRRVKSAGDFILVASEQGVFQLDFSEVGNQKPKSWLTDMIGIPFGKKNDAFKQLTPADLILEPPIDFASIQGTNDILLLAKKSLYRMNLVEEDGATRFDIVAQKELDLKDGVLCLLGANQTWGVILTDEEIAWRVNLSDLSLESDLPAPLIENSPQTIRVDADTGDFFVLTGDATLYHADQNAKSARLVDSSGDLTAMALGPDGNVFVARNGNVVEKLNDKGVSVGYAARPVWSRLQWIYWTIVRPIYVVNPKPSAVNGLIQHVLTKDNPISFGQQTEELEESKIAVDLWTPIWSNALFIAVLLTASCIYLYRQDV